MNEYGPFSQVVSIAGSIIATSAALVFSFKQRANWEPWEEDVPKGPQRVIGLISAIVIAILWATITKEEIGKLLNIIYLLLPGTFIFLIIYGVLISTCTYEKEIITSNENNNIEIKKIIGGFKLNEQAKKHIESNDVTTQEYFRGTGYDVEKVWTRSSRTLSKQLFVISYMGLIFCGTVALATASILVSFKLNN